MQQGDSITQLTSYFPQAAEQYYQLIIVPYQNTSPINFRQIAETTNSGYINVNLELSRRLLELTQRQRALKVEELLKKTDQRTGAQIELVPHRTIMVNAGASLVSQKDLMNGGTSTARNPLIARALKLIGFAELAGSGLGKNSRVWRHAKRPPIIESSEKNNRFRIELDSRPLKIVADTFWKKRLGVTITPEAARILGFLGNAPGGMTLAEICSETGASSDNVLVMCQGLQNRC